MKNPDPKFKSKFSKLKFDSTLNKGHGAWVCLECGAQYNQPENWNPPCDWCMRCHVNWMEVDNAEN